MNEKRAHELIWKALYLESEEAVLLFSPDQFIQAANQQAIEQFEISIGQGLGTVFNNESCLNLSNLLLSGFEGSCFAQLEDKERNSFNAVVTMLGDVGVVLRIISPSVHLQLEEQSRLVLLGKLIGDLAHSMSNPLAVLQGRVELLLSKKHTFDKKILHHFNSLNGQCKRISRQLQIVQVLAKRKMARPQQVYLKDFFSSFPFQTLSTKLSYRHNVEPKDLQVLIDPLQLQIILSQLVIGLLEKLHFPTKVYFDCGEGDEKVEIGIQFNSNLQDSSLQSIFEELAIGSHPYYAIGYKLILCSLLVQDLDGALSFQSRREGFFALLSFPKETTSLLTKQLSVALNIMVIDDHSNLRETLSAQLREEGHQIIAVPSAEEALIKMSRQALDIIVTDIRLPGINGEEFYEMMRNTDPLLARKIILISGAQYNPKHKNTPFLRKPFSKRQLLQMIERISS